MANAILRPFNSIQKIFLINIESLVCSQYQKLDKLAMFFFHEVSFAIFRLAFITRKKKDTDFFLIFCKYEVSVLFMFHRG